MSALSHIIGPEAQVRKALDKVRNSTLVEDKRAGMSDLANIAKHEPLAASAAFPVIVPMLTSCKGDLEMVREILETLLGCLHHETDSNTNSNTNSISRTFAEQQQYTTTLLDLLEERDWSVRLGILKVLNSLASERLASLQQAVLSSPQGLARLMDVLNDSREIIRNEVLLVMVALAKGNTEVQKIMAFEGAFDTLFGIVKEEDEGSIILADCLVIVNNLLHGNPSNATFFREMAGVSGHIVPLLERPIIGGPAWEQRWQLLLEVVSNLLSPPEALQSAQTAMGKQGVLLAVAEACTSKIISKAAKALSLRMLGVLVHKHTPNRITLSTYTSKCDGMPLLHHLLSSCLHERVQRDDASHEVNTAATFFWKCYLSGNVDGQQHLAATLMPQPIFDDDFGGPGEGSAPVLPIGRIIISSLMAANEADWRQISEGSIGAIARLTEVWGAATVLGYILEGNSVCQEIAVATPMELPMSEKPPEQLLKCTIRMLTRGGKGSAMDYRATTALLRLLCVWSYKCPRAAEGIVSDPAMIMCLLGWLGSSPPTGGGTPDAHGGAAVPAHASIHVRGAAAFLLSSCLQHVADQEQAKGVFGIVEGRVGLDTFQEQMDLAVASEAFAAARRRDVALAAPKPTPDDLAWGYLIYDAEAAAMLAHLAEAHSKCVFRLLGGGGTSPGGRAGSDAALQRERDALKEEVELLRGELVRAGATAAVAEASSSADGGSAAAALAQRRCEELEETLRDLQASYQKQGRDCEGLAQSNRILEETLAARDERISELELAAAGRGGGGGGAGGGDQQEALVRTLRERVQALEATDRAAAGELRAMARETEDLRARAAALQSQLDAARGAEAAAVRALDSARAEAATARAEAAAAAAAAAAVGGAKGEAARCGELEKAVAAAVAERDEARAALADLEGRFKALTEEHEDLLVMLAEQQGGEDEEEGEGEGE